MPSTSTPTLPDVVDYDDDDDGGSLPSTVDEDVPDELLDLEAAA